jgi:hypothetical protein
MEFITITENSQNIEMKVIFKREFWLSKNVSIRIQKNSSPHR